MLIPRHVPSFMENGGASLLPIINSRADDIAAAGEFVV
jgi:hypothetical protein